MNLPHLALVALKSGVALLIAFGAIGRASAQSPDSLSALNVLQAGQVDQAIQLSDDACEDGDMDSCTLSGMIHAQARFGVNDQKFARMRFETACDGGHMEACIPLAQMRYNGLGGDVDKMGAFRIAKKACEAGSREACAAADQIEPEVTTTLSLPGLADPSHTNSDWDEVSALYAQMSERLETRCSTNEIGSAEEAKAVADSCLAFTSQFSNAAFDMDESEPETSRAIVNFAAAWSIVARTQMYLDLYAMGRLPKDPMKVQCSAYDTAEFFMSKSKALEASPVQTRYVMVQSQIAAGRAICGSI